MSGGDRRRRTSSRFEPFRGACPCTRDEHMWQVEARSGATLVRVDVTCWDHLAQHVADLAPRHRDAVTVRRIGGAA